jgi:hypothetical protein
MQAKGRRGAYYRVVVTAALQAHFVARILPALERAGSAWYRLPTFEDDDKRAEIVALGWKLYLEDIARGILQPSPGAIASYARRGVGAGKTLVHPSATNLRCKPIPLVYVNSQTMSVMERTKSIIGYDVAPVEESSQRKYRSRAEVLAACARRQREYRARKKMAGLG